MRLVELTDVHFNTKEPDRESVSCYVFTVLERVGINIADNGTGWRTDLSLAREDAAALGTALLETVAESRELESQPW